MAGNLCRPSATAWGNGLTVLVTGATGCIGYALTTRLVETGEWGTVRVLVRPDSDTLDLPSGVDILYGDIEGDLEPLRVAVRNVDCILHAAAKVHDPNGTDEEFDRINRRGTERLLEACIAEKTCPRFLFYSTVAVYGEETPPEGISEDTPTAPVSPYAKSKAEAEAAVSHWGQEKQGIPTILRVATVYGPRDRGNMVRMIDAIARRRFLLPGGGQNRKTCVSVENVVRVSLAIARAPVEMVREKVILIADPMGGYELRVLAAAMAEALAIPARFPVVPSGLLSLVAMPLKAVFGERSPITRIQIRRLMANNLYITQKQREIIDDSELISLSEGMKNAVSWWKSGTKRSK